jgi:hypothetical protein
MVGNIKLLLILSGKTNLGSIMITKLVIKYLCGEMILRKTENGYNSDPWTILMVHTKGTITVPRGSISERLNIRRELITSILHL